MGNSMLLQASFGSVLVSGKSLHRRIVQVRRADFTVVPSHRVPWGVCHA